MRNLSAGCTPTVGHSTKQRTITLRAYIGSKSVNEIKTEKQHPAVVSGILFELFC